MLVTSEEQVRHRCQVAFTIDDNYHDNVWRDVVPLDARDILLVSAWMCDKNGIHRWEIMHMQLLKMAKCYTLSYEIEVHQRND